MYTLKEAAEAVGLGKPALLKQIQRGKLSATRDPLGRWRIDPAELHRVYPPKGEIEQWETHNASMELVAARTKLEALERENRDLRETLQRETANLQEERDHWRKMALSLLPAPETRLPWWKRLFFSGKAT